MPDKGIVKSLLKLKLRLADEVIGHLPKEARSQAGSSLHCILQGVDEAIKEYRGEATEVEQPAIKPIPVE